MDILSQIQAFLEKLDSKSTELDFDNLRSLLSEAYQVTSQGLKLSNDAHKYSGLKKEFDEIKAAHTAVNEKFQSASEKNSLLESSIEALEPVVESLRNDLQAKVSVINRYNSDKKTRLINNIISCSVSDLVILKSDIESDFEYDWKENEPQVLESKSQFMDFTPYKIGD